MSESIYFVWCPAAGAPTKKHGDILDAQAEALRLCKLPENHGREFFVLRAIESVRYATDPIVRRKYCKYI